MKQFPTISIPAPLDFIGFIVLTDGTVYENLLYRCNLPKPDAEQLSDTFDHMTTILCDRLPVKKQPTPPPSKVKR